MITRWEERDRGPGCGVRSVLATSGSGTPISVKTRCQQRSLY